MRLSALFTSLVLAFFFVIISSANISAQTAAFTYQGRLNDTALPQGNGSYTMKFRLYDAETGGNQVGNEQTALVTVNNGVFTTTLDFTAAPFSSGQPRFLEIQIAGTTLSPRQRLSSAPYAIRSTSAAVADNANSLGGVAASQYAQITDSRLTDSRNPLPGSGNYVQNTTTQQPSTNFNISGDGTVGGTISGNIVNAIQYNRAGARILDGSYITGNLFVGLSAGSFTNTGTYNSFVGINTGEFNTTGSYNTFVGSQSGRAMTTESRNTFLGAYTEGGASITNATAIGYSAKVTQSNSLVLGSIKNVNFGSADTNVGIGTTAPLTRLDVRGDLFLGLTSTPSVPFVNSLFVNNDGGDANNFFRLDGSSNNLYIVSSSSANASAGAGIIFRTATAGGGEVDRVGIYPDGTVGINVLGAAGGTQLCRNALLIISNCSSSLRYKTDIKPFSFGMSLINQLRPISYNWKEGGASDVGFGAEDVARINPLFVTYNARGEVEGVKYDRLSVAFVNAFREQQQQIEEQKIINQNLQTKVEQQQQQHETQKTQIQEQQKQIDQLKQVVCSFKPDATVCKETKK